MKPEVKQTLDQLAAARATAPANLRHVPLASLHLDSDTHQPVLTFYSHGEPITQLIDVADATSFQPFI